MGKYGQYCPLARALELVGDRWTLLIIRDLLSGTKHFNDLERGLPGISRKLLSQRLQKLRLHGLIEKRFNSASRRSTEYHLTEAGSSLFDIVVRLANWGSQWAFSEPTQEELDSGLLMLWMYRGVNLDQLPDERIVVEFNFFEAEPANFWLVLNRQDVTLCLTDPGFGIDVLVTSSLATFYQLWQGVINYRAALNDYNVRVEGIPRLTRGFPNWFEWGQRARATVEIGT